jgi:hypothetical protein
MTLNRRATIVRALEVAELVDRYIPRAIQKDDDFGSGLMSGMASVLEDVRGAMAAPDNTTQESLRRLAARSSLLLEEYQRRMLGRPSKKNDMPNAEIGEGDEQEESDDEDDSPATMSLKKAIRRRLRGTDSARAFWQSLGYK